MIRDLTVELRDVNRKSSIKTLRTYSIDEFMLIDDHINLQGGSPLAFKGVEKLGERFVDLNQPYDPIMNAKLEEIAAAHAIHLHKGVYASVVGPQLETRAEYRYLKIIGADAVGMSTVPEGIVGRQLGMDVLGISCITNVAAGLSDGPLSHQEVSDTASRVEKDFVDWLHELLAAVVDTTCE